MMQSERARMTKYEATRIIGIRTAQLESSAPITISNIPVHLKSNFLYIACKELINGTLDIYVRRPLPYNAFYEIHVRDIDLPEDLYILEEMLNP